jgi:hypothetical protein
MRKRQSRGTYASRHLQPRRRPGAQPFDRGGMRETAISPDVLHVAHRSASGSRALLGLNIGSEQQDPLSSEATYRVGAAWGADSRGMLSPTVRANIENETFQTKAPAIGSGFVQLLANAALRLGHGAYLHGGLTDGDGGRRSSYGGRLGCEWPFEGKGERGGVEVRRHPFFVGGILFVCRRWRLVHLRDLHGRHSSGSWSPVTFGFRFLSGRCRQVARLRGGRFVRLYRIDSLSPAGRGLG